MIRNERQYRITRAQASNFQKAIQELGPKPAKGNPVLLKAQREALRSQLNDLLAELAEYEALQSGKRPSLQLDSIDELPRALIRARIAKGLTQKQLGEKIGVREQQIQRYEASEYATASFARMKQVIQALKMKFKEKVLLE